ncbi:transcriptional regulator, LacI family [Abditibacterium utsteinense]|uniref:Transcriptional regulator, LacI family n=1 Tax=Abditibacterium utsteinense TaxID=1960156 RepID=A0A2S8SU87_9BACT|nr:LacI family DNA-binding transcriptional regulator [Abditibacterium utsteinense]PQV64350.1 transcriptional regulator, LacI family [Abditibacterium utsteinense]
MLRMTDIAARAGVSQTTVSFVLNGRESSVRISENTRNRVLAAAEELGYRSNHLARAMRTGTTNMLGFIGGDLCSEHVGRMLDGALEEAEKHGYTLKILPHREGDNSMEQIVRRASELRLTGVAALHLPLEMLEMLRAEARHCGSAMVLLDTPASINGVAQVMSDDQNGVFLLVEHLVKLGHKRIGMISSDPISTHAVVREKAFHSAMESFNLDVPQNCIARGDFRQLEPSRAATRSLLELPPGKRPTAIFGIGDLVACAALQAANQMDLNVPRDVSIVGFGDLRASHLSVPLLTTIHQPFREMGERAVQRLICQASGQSDARSKARRDGPPENFASVEAEKDVIPQKMKRATGQRDSDDCKDDCQVERLPILLMERASTAPPA